MGIIVQKFGGTSVADTDKIKNVAKAVIREKNNGNDVIVVVSAMGHTTDYLVKNGFDKLLNNAFKMKKHHESKFMASWKKSPKYCLWKFFIRKKIGNILRKIKILED